MISYVIKTKWIALHLNLHCNEISPYTLEYLLASQ